MSIKPTPIFVLAYAAGKKKLVGCHQLLPDSTIALADARIREVFGFAHQAHGRIVVRHNGKNIFVMMPKKVQDIGLESGPVRVRTKVAQAMTLC